MSDVTINLTPELYEYLKTHSLREPDVLKQLREQTHKMSMGQMQISPEQGQFMRLLIELIGARNVLEIGVFTGYSTLSMALGLPSDGRIIACDINIEWTRIAKRYWELANVADRIDLRLAEALQTLDQLLLTEAGTFDFVFIDADKANYMSYYEKSLSLLRPGGLILVDNALWEGDVANPLISDTDTVAIRALNDKVHQDQRVTMSLLPLGDGVLLARKR